MGSESWTVDANLYKHTSAGQEIVIDIPEETFVGFQEFITGFKRISQVLLDLDIPDSGVDVKSREGMPS